MVLVELNPCLEGLGFRGLGVQGFRGLGFRIKASGSTGLGFRVKGQGDVASLLLIWIAGVRICF